MITKPILLDNHYAGNQTIIIGNWCGNGCQFFHKDEAEDIFDEFEVSDQERLDVMNAFSDEQIDFNALLESGDIPYDYLIKMGDDPIFLKQFTSKAVARWEDRALLAKKGIKELNDILINDTDWYVRVCVAETCDDADILKSLTKDDSTYVRKSAKNKLQNLLENR